MNLTPCSAGLGCVCPLQMNYNNKNNLVGAMIVAGYDAQAGGQVGARRGRSSLPGKMWQQ
jgi:hypothetical protein